ncbi:MAG: M36 family metallopeptidase [Bacteroidetes bacterium]|nr:M36 family metallopeptidase [Bacteroidota bacterium]
MRKLLLLFVAAFSLLFTNAQLSQSDIAAAKQAVSKNSAAIGLTADDLNNIIVSSTYVTKEGIRMVYLYQSYKNIPVYNQMHVLAFKNDKVVSVAGGRIPMIGQKVNNPNGVPSISSKEAVLAAFAESKIDSKFILGNLDNPGTNAWGKTDYGRLGVSSLNITAELMWVPLEDGKQLKLAWQIFVAPLHTADMWQIRVDAADHSIIGKDNLTVYDHWGHDDHKKSESVKTNKFLFDENYVTAPKNEIQQFKVNRTPVVNSATYRVVKYPAESPQHPGGAPSLHTDPWTMAGGNATTLKWHNDGAVEHDSTRGNNVYAAEDRNSTNAVIDKAAVSQTPQPNLTFDYVPDFTQSPLLTTPPNQQFNITNLFYMNNIMHDMVYIYGFDEVSGNFQRDNMGRGGLGNDHVFADAQDGGGTNNANFGTPVDGQNPRMQMYIWTAPNPDRDGDVDNGIIAHEFGHGISNRLTGGPGNSSCVGNAEHGGEGWSDYYALMLTTNWATATPADGALARPIGTYALGQPITGAGIRSFPYSTNIAINPLVYSTTLPAQVHNRGEYWCEALWEMTWEMIQQTGINPNLFNASGVGGNSAAIKLVTEGMKLQPCGPGFIDARNAILKADTLFFGAQYSCSIWKAFAKRGMGRNASQGSAASVTDQVPSFVVDNGIFSITQSAPAVPEGSNVTYTNKITAGNCSPITNFFITDTLPTNVTYVSGGTYNAGNRTITFGPINLTSGQSQNYPFTVTVNAGTYFAPLTPLNETVPGPGLPAGWSINPPTGNTWTVSSVASNSAPSALFAPNAAVVSDMNVASVAYTLNPATVSNYSKLSFWHRFNTEDGWDGGVVEISTNGGATWADLGSRIISGKYNGSLGTGSNNPIGGRSAFTGLINSFMKTEINLSSFAGQNVNIRFRFASDDNTAPTGGGWFVDDIVIYSEPAVLIKSNLFTPASLLVGVTDTITRITVGCIAAGITSHPASLSSCSGSNASFTVVASGTPVSYQWQVNTGSGFVNIPAGAPYSGINTATLTITGVTIGLNNYQYRCVISNGCTAASNSNPATLTVGATAAVNSNPTSVTICEGANTSFSITATGATSYQWQVNTGSGFVDIPAGAPYGGTTTTTLTITGATAALTGNQYRCVLGSCGSPLNSTAATLTISVPVSITAQPAGAALCNGDGYTFNVNTTGTVASYQWQFSTDGGATYTNIAGATTSSYALTAATGQNNYRFRCVVTGSCGPVNSTAATITVNPKPEFSLSTNPYVVCVSDPAFTLSASAAGGTWSGTGVQAGQFIPAVAGAGPRSLTYTLTQAGCTTAKTVAIQVNDCKDRHLLLNQFTAVDVFPNPNNGRFNIRLNTDLYSTLGLKVFASDGKLVKDLSFSGLAYGSVVPVDLSKMPSGTYQLYMYNDQNGFISKGVSIIVYRN